MNKQVALSYLYQKLDEFKLLVQEEKSLREAKRQPPQVPEPFTCPGQTRRELYHAIYEAKREAREKQLFNIKARRIDIDFEKRAVINDYNHYLVKLFHTNSILAFQVLDIHTSGMNYLYDFLKNDFEKILRENDNLNAVFRSGLYPNVVEAYKLANSY